MTFLLQEQPIDGPSPLLALGLVVAAGAVGNAAGSLLGNRLGHRVPTTVATTALAVATVAAAAPALSYSLAAVLVLGLVTGALSQVCRLCLDALVQRDLPDGVQARVFARIETRLQLAWVAGGAVAITVPLLAWLGFGFIAGLLAAVLLVVVTIRRRGTGSAAGGAPPP